MSKVICKAGVVGPYSFVIVGTDPSDVVASIYDQDKEKTQRYISMDFAEKCIDKELTTLIGNLYEVE